MIAMNPKLPAADQCPHNPSTARIVLLKERPLAAIDILLNSFAGHTRHWAAVVAKYAASLGVFLRLGQALDPFEAFTPTRRDVVPACPVSSSARFGAHDGSESLSHPTFPFPETARGGCPTGQIGLGRMPLMGWMGRIPGPCRHHEGSRCQVAAPKSQAVHVKQRQVDQIGSSLVKKKVPGCRLGHKEAVPPSFVRNPVDAGRSRFR
jgi:hypothetical protein